MNEQLQSLLQLVEESTGLSESEKSVLTSGITQLFFSASKDAERLGSGNGSYTGPSPDLRDIREELEETKEALHEAHASLKAAQTQLIHSEKMASLGELTAGIAHEIQNPLNFINNFSEVSVELLEELREEHLQQMDQSDRKQAEEVISELTKNLQKISYHGKRADSIVKGMLQHSRKSDSRKEHTDINRLVDEYLRLSYHGLRAKDKSFNATLQTEFDESIGEVEVVPQDVGRVLLNLFNNAFYSVTEKKKKQNGSYVPTVSVSTKRLPKYAEICVRDNGIGISKSSLDKIFQPFFTTKPTGEGTGLGLSISYEIITKEHGGEMKVQTREGEFAEFTVLLPL